MNCTECEDLRLERLLGRLDATSARAFDAHVAGCASCAAGMELDRGVRAALADLPGREAPHVASLALYEYLHARETMDAALREDVQIHLRTCAACRADAETIATLSAVPLGEASAAGAAAGAAASAPGALPWWRGLLGRPRLAVAAAIAVVLVGSALVPRLLERARTPPVRWAETEIATPVATRIPMRLVRRSAEPRVVVPLRGEESRILAVDVSFVDLMAEHYTIRLVDARDRVVWRDTVYESALRDGTLYLEVETSRLPAGILRLELFEQEAGGPPALLATADLARAPVHLDGTR